MLKFYDIPQFTSSGRYKVDMSMEILVKQIDLWIKEEGLQLNPDFQRGHVWTKEQQIKYIEYVLRGGRSGRDLYFNCPSWMKSNYKGKYRDFVCVDGLQRITAIQRFLNNEITAFGQYYSEFGGKTNLICHGVQIHVNDLPSRKDVLQWYVEMNEGGTPHSQAEIERVKKMIANA